MAVRVCRQTQRSDVDARLGRDRAIDLPRTFNDDNAVQPRPFVALTQPFDVLDDGRGAGFDAAVIAVDGLGAADLGIGKPIGFLLCAEQVNIVAQAALVAFQRQHVVGLLVDDLLCDVALAAHRIDGDDRAFDRHQVEQFRDCHYFVRLLRHLDLAEHEALAGGEGGDHVDRRLAALAVVGAAQGLAVDRDHAFRRAGQRGDPGDEAALELIGIQGSEDVAKMIVRGRAVPKRPEPAHQVDLPSPEAGDVDEGVGARQNSE